MPAGVLGPTIMPVDHRPSIIRWHGPEWREFIKDIEGYKHRVLEAQRSAANWAREHRQKCQTCRKTYHAMMRLRKYQRGSLSGGSVKRSSMAAGDCTFTQSTIPNLNEFNIEPTDSYTHARLHSDGDWYSAAVTNTSWGSTDGTWQGGCAVADYDTRWNQISGDVENGTNTVGVDGVWSAATTSAAVGYQVNNQGNEAGSFNLQCRDGTSLNLLFTDSFNMDCEVDSRN